MEQEGMYEQRTLEALYRKGKIPPKFFFAMINDPIRAYEEQRKIFLERIVEQDSEALEAIIQKQIDDILQQME